MITGGAAPQSPINLQTIAAAILLANKLAAGDANPDFEITGDGKLQWGAGGASALDTSLSRAGAGALTIGSSHSLVDGSGNFFADGGYFIGQGAHPISLQNNGNGVFSGSVQLGSSSTMFSGTGAPGAGTGANGDYYFRTDTPGTANQRLYVKSVGTWTGVL